MSDEPAHRTLHETAVLSKDFLDTIARMAHEHQLAPDLVISLFGLFAKHVIDSAVKNGDSRREVTTRLLTKFLSGAGIEAVFDNANPMKLQ